MYSSPSEDRCKAHWLHACGQNGQFQLQTRWRFRINLSKSNQLWEVTWIHDTFMKKGWVSDELKLLKGLLEGSTLRQWIQGEVAGVKRESEILTRLEAISTFGESNSRIWVPSSILWLCLIHQHIQEKVEYCLHILLALMLNNRHIGCLSKAVFLGTWIILVHSQGAWRAFGCWCMGFCRSIVDAPCLKTWDRTSQKRLEETYPAGCEWSNSNYWEVFDKTHNFDSKFIIIYRCDVDTPNVLWCFFSLPPAVLFGEGVFAFGRGAFNVMAVLPSSLRLLQCSSKATKVWQKFPWNDLGCRYI